MNEIKFYRSEKISHASIVLMKPHIILEKCRFSNCAVASIAINPPHAEAFDKIDAYDTEFDHCTFFCAPSVAQDLTKALGLISVTHPVYISVFDRIKGFFARG